MSANNHHNIVIITIYSTVFPGELPALVNNKAGLSGYSKKCLFITVSLARCMSSAAAGFGLLGLRPVTYRWHQPPIAALV